MAAGGHRFGDSLGGEDGTDGKAPGKTFRHGDNIRPDSAWFKREDMPGTANADLHLIGNKKTADFIA